MTRRKVLLVEDEESILEPLTAALGREGFDVVTATTAADGLDAFRKRAPDAVLLDVMMPEMDGPATLRGLIDRGAAFPIVFITARASEGDIAHLLSLGAAGVITKPFDPMKLASLVRAYLHHE